MKNLIFFILLLITTPQVIAADCKEDVAQNLTAETFREGDIIFISSKSPQSEMLEEATKSHWTHVGIILVNPLNNKLEVYEASSQVKFTAIKAFIGKSRNAQVSLKRLNLEACQDLKKTYPKTDCQLQQNFEQKVKSSVKRLFQKPYDIYFADNEEAIYCSELTSLIYKEAFNINLGEWVKFRKVLGLDDFEDWKTLKDDPTKAHVYETIMKRFDGGKTFTPEMPVVTPISQFNSPLLSQIYECSSF